MSSSSISEFVISLAQSRRSARPNRRIDSPSDEPTRAKSALAWGLGAPSGTACWGEVCFSHTRFGYSRNWLGPGIPTALVRHRIASAGMSPAMPPTIGHQPAGIDGLKTLTGRSAVLRLLKPISRSRLNDYAGAPARIVVAGPATLEQLQSMDLRKLAIASPIWNGESSWM